MWAANWAFLITSKSHNSKTMSLTDKLTTSLDAAFKNTALIKKLGRGSPCAETFKKSPAETEVQKWSLHKFIYLFIYLFIKTSFAWVTKLSVNTVFQFGPWVIHNTSKIETNNKFVIIDSQVLVFSFLNLINNVSYANSLNSKTKLTNTSLSFTSPL